MAPRAPNSNVVSDAVGQATLSRNRPMCSPRSAHVSTRIVALCETTSTTPAGCSLWMRSTAAMDRAAMEKPPSPPGGGCRAGSRHPGLVSRRLGAHDVPLSHALPGPVGNLAQPLVDRGLKLQEPRRRLDRLESAPLGAHIESFGAKLDRESADSLGLREPARSEKRIEVPAEDALTARFGVPVPYEVQSQHSANIAPLSASGAPLYALLRHLRSCHASS
jgi:hypothetical protein